MSQTKLQTWIEVNVGTWTGFIGSWLITVAVMHYIDVLGLALASTITTLLCTAWSLVRGYAVRRYFNRKLAQQQRKSYE